MKDNEFKNFLRQSLQQNVPPERLKETVTSCVEMMREQKIFTKEPRTGFFRYLSDVFRLEGMAIVGWQAAALFFVCLAVSTLTDMPKNIPVFIPLFVLAVMPVIFKSQLYGMSEIEAATRASGAQIILAKLILAGAANLVCMTALLCFEVYLQDSWQEIGQMILYCLVPYLVCMAFMLRLVRLRKKESIPIYAVATFSSCVCWGMSARALPWLYETSAIGVWVLAFIVFTFFFIKEIYFIVMMRKEGKIYGIIT